MSENYAARENQRLAHELQTKFEFWLIGLIFAVLALAVQTATFTGSKTGQLCELTAWVLLLVAGLIGVWRLEWAPSFYQLGSRRARHEAIMKKLQEIETTGHRSIYDAQSREFQDLSSLMKQVQENIKLVDKRMTPIQQKQLVRYRLMRALVIAGFALLLIARGHDPALNLVNPPPDATQAQTPPPMS